MKTIKIPKVKDIITARPEGMDYETYRQIRKEQKDALHGWNETVMDGRTRTKKHHAGRLECAARFATQDWINSKECQVVIVEQN